MLKMMMAMPSRMMESNTSGREANNVLMTIFREDTLVIVLRGLSTLNILRELAENPT